MHNAVIEAQNICGEKMENINMLKGKKLPEKLKEKVSYFKNLYKKDITFRMREMHIEGLYSYDCAVIFFDGMVDTEKLNNGLIRPLLSLKVENRQKTAEEFLKKQILYNNEVALAEDLYSLITAINLGDTAILLDGTTNALIVNTKGWRTRGINEPQDERILQGPREGFDEALMLNAAMLRRKLSTPDLCFESITVGVKTQTHIFVCYLDSIVNKDILENVMSKIKKINIDGILDSNYISELINKNKFSLFKTVGTTERPDIVAARLLEGRIAILVDGTPVVLTIPYLFVENFQSDDDYYLNYIYAFLGRLLRYLCYNLSVILPSLYLAVTIFHPNLLPASFFSSVSVARSGIPFPSSAECLILIFIFEILRETGIRMQQSVGHALSIVGGLVVGQAAVDAKLVSAPLLIVVAMSGISGLIVPRLKAAVVYSKIFLVVLTSFLGVFGLFIGMTVLHIHLYSLESFSVDYLSTVSKFTKNSLKDTVFRVPWWKMLTRPAEITKDIIRQRKNND